MFCNNCGKQLPDGIAFCPQCGAPQANQGGAYNCQPAPSVGFGKAIQLFFSRYTEFSGRSRRSEYWWAYLATGLISLLLALIIPSLTWIWSLATLIPGYAIFIRRLHDIGKSGWFILIGLIPLVGPILMLVWLCTDSAPDNEWGPNPKMIRVEQPAAYAPAPAVAAPPALNEPAAPPTPPVPSYSEPMFTQPQFTTPNPQNAYQPPVPEAPSGIILDVLSGPMAGKRYSLGPGKSAVIGRTPGKCDIALPAYNSVSGAHCQITCYADCVTIQDLGSTNGSFVNDSRLPPHTPITVTKTVTLHLANANCAIRIDMSRLRVS